MGTKFTLPNIISVIAVILIAVSAYYVMTRTDDTSALSTTDPADVVIMLSDLPSGWGESMSTYKTSADYATGYAGPLPETGYYVKFSNGPISVVSEAIRFSSTNDANSFYDYLYGISPVGAGVSHTRVGDESLVMVLGENIAGFFRKSNFIVYNASEVEFSLSEFVAYLRLCESRI